MSCGWLEVPEESLSLCGIYRATLAGQGLGASLAPEGLGVHSGVLLQQRWSNRHRVQPDHIYLPRNCLVLQQFASIRQNYLVRKAAVTAAAVGPLAPRRLPGPR